MPVRNVAAFVRAAVDSVLSQSWADLELIIIDDGSTDSTAIEIAEIDDPRIAFRHVEHGSLPQARNTAAGAARGRYIAFLDGDDLWAPGILQRQIEFLETNPSIVLSFASMKMIDRHGRDLGRSIQGWSGTLDFSELLTEDVIGTGAVVMRRELLDTVGLFDEELERGSDHDYWLRVALAYPTGLFGFPEVGLLYRRRAGQLSANWRRKEDAWHQLLEKMLRLAPVRSVKVAGRACANLDRALAAIAYENSEPHSALRLFLRALKHAPWFLIRDKRTWFLGAALLSARVLPGGIHHRAEQWFRTARAYRT